MRVIAGGLHLAAFSPDGRSLIGSVGQEIRRLDPATGSTIGTPLAAPMSVLALLRLESGTYLAGGDFGVIAASAETGQRTAVIPPFDGKIVGMVAHPDGKAVYSWGLKGYAWRWSAGELKPLSREFNARRALRAVAFSPDGKLALIGDAEQVRVWHVATGKPVGPPLMLPAMAVGVAFVPGGKDYVAVAQNGLIVFGAIPPPFAGAVPGHDTIRGREGPR